MISYKTMDEVVALRARIEDVAHLYQTALYDGIPIIGFELTNEMKIR